jgi:hypothetical protein
MSGAFTKLDDEETTLRQGFDDRSWVEISLHRVNGLGLMKCLIKHECM